MFNEGPWAKVNLFDGFATHTLFVELFAGGKSYSKAKYLDVIFELKSNGQGWVGSWTTLTAKLQHPRSWHVVIPVFTDKDDACKLIV